MQIGLCFQPNSHDVDIPRDIAGESLQICLQSNFYDFDDLDIGNSFLDIKLITRYMRQLHLNLLRIID